MARPALRVSTEDPTPAYEQLRRQLVDLIASGAVPAGERLPPVRQLAADLGLAVGTVARTYRELEAAGLVATRRGGGTRVTDRPIGHEPAVRRRSLAEAAEGLVRHARLLGAADDEVRAAVAQALSTGAVPAGEDPGLPPRVDPHRPRAR